MNNLKIPNNVDYSFLILQSSEKVYRFIEEHGIFITNARDFWELNKHMFENLSEGKQKEIFDALCTIEEVCIELLKEGFDE